MKEVALNELALGSVADANIINANGLIILREGSIIDEKNLRILKMWGVKTVRIENRAAAGANESNVEETETDIELIERNVREKFTLNDVEHPFIKKLLECCVDREMRSQYHECVPSTSTH